MFAQQVDVVRRERVHRPAGNGGCPTPAQLNIDAVVDVVPYEWTTPGIYPPPARYGLTLIRGRNDRLSPRRGEYDVRHGGHHLGGYDGV